jgi:Flp pilus assembly CpaE family ATPase
MNATSEKRIELILNHLDEILIVDDLDVVWPQVDHDLQTIEFELPDIGPVIFDRNSINNAQNSGDLVVFELEGSDGMTHKLSALKRVPLEIDDEN